jgi:hypothetical protein
MSVYYLSMYYHLSRILVTRQEHVQSLHSIYSYTNIITND